MLAPEPEHDPTRAQEASVRGSAHPASDRVLDVIDELLQVVEHDERRSEAAQRMPDLAYEVEGYAGLLVVDAWFTAEAVPGRVRVFGPARWLKRTAPLPSRAGVRGYPS